MKNKLSDKGRVKTGIEGFDALVEGGFPRSSNILISGGPGTGKTIFSLAFLYFGAMKNKETGIYFTFEEKKQDLIEQAKQFNWDLEKLEKKGKLRMISIGLNNIDFTTINEIIEIIKNLNAKRVVIDSITTLSFISPENSGNNGVSETSIKKFLYYFLSKFKDDLDLTTLFISQKDEIICDNIARYLCDGVLDIKYESLGGDFSRYLSIQKMRKTKNNEDLHPIEISVENGIVVHNLD